MSYIVYSSITRRKLASLTSSIRTHYLTIRYQEVLAAYYASYDPIWSPNGEWFLLRLKDEYAHTTALPITNDEGDLYLVASEYWRNLPPDVHTI